MQLLVQILSFGTAWWVRPGQNNDDSKRYTEHAAYFNSTGIEYGSKIHKEGPVSGLLRFNFSSGLDTRHTHTNIGRIFRCNEIERYRETNRLLVLHRVQDDVQPTHFLVRIASRLHGAVLLRTTWCSSDVRLIAASRFRGVQELLLLMTLESHVVTRLGVWRLCRQVTELPRLILVDDTEPVLSGRVIA